ncbi:c-type cytochrome [Dokdonella sp.]|uniref:c-type cytochrome n=1 Tax=Dokdonella sp. TaxID=2291710 RepID=UPI001B0B15F0|nr:c-type cytochrome [Dokdonella sp.]MBO9663363.1 cytochrome c4 [Dokdonella sp.]
MNVPTRLCFLLVAALAAPRMSAAIEWIDLRGAAPIRGDAATGAAKATVCVACHGPNGNAVVPAFPRLAGQRADYLYWRLANFKRGARPESVMTAQTANLSDADLHDLAAYFAAQTATKSPLPAMPSARGESLFRDGDPARGTPPCQGCHGADARGPADSRFATWPALRGQNADYLAARLKAYRDGKDAVSSNEFVMRGVARSLDDEAIAALAAWLASHSP